MGDLSERSSSTEEGETEGEEDEDVEIIYSQLTPYQGESLAEVHASAKHEMQMISRKGNLTKTGLQQQLRKRDTSSFILDFYAVILGLMAGLQCHAINNKNRNHSTN